MEKLDKRMNNGGRPAVEPELRKKPVTIYEPEAHIELLGGIDKVREFLRECFDAAVQRNEPQKKSELFQHSGIV